MPIVTSRVGVVTDALVTKLKASATFADPSRVYDGPNTAGDTQWTQAVFVGFDGNWHTDSVGNVVAGQYEAVLIDQQLPFVGPTTMKEELQIRCCAEAWGGDPNTQVPRNAVLTMLAGVEDVLRTDPTLGIDGSTVATLQTGSLYYVYDSQGNLAARIPFVIKVETFLTTS